VFALVGDRQALARMIFGLPGGRDFGTDTAPVLSQLLGRERGIEAIEQQLGDALILPQHGSPRAFGGMGREHRLDADPAEQLEHLLEREAPGFQLPEGSFHTTGLRTLAGFDEVAAAAADAMHLLGEVDHAKPGGERPCQIASHLRRAPAKLDTELGGGFLVAGAAADR
jgi:hypothetical protein